MGNKGFTLVEVLIVVAIIALLLAITVPQFLKVRCQEELKEHGSYVSEFCPGEGEVTAKQIQKTIPEVQQCAPCVCKCEGNSGLLTVN